MRQSTTQPFLMDSTPQQLRGIVFGIYFGLSMEGASMLQPVVGHFMDTFGIVEVFHIIALISVALSLVVLLALIRSKVSRQAPSSYLVCQNMNYAIQLEVLTQTVLEVSRTR